MSQQGIRTFLETVAHIFVRMNEETHVSRERAQIEAMFCNRSNLGTYQIYIAISSLIIA
jgi:hypothetical protein